MTFATEAELSKTFDLVVRGGLLVDGTGGAPFEGLRDRGALAVGQRADLNVIDYDKLTLRSPEVTYDLPAGGRRLMQRAEGYVATIVAGTVTYLDGEPSGALPGWLVRGRRG